MRNAILYLLVISFLLQSCYTYKAVDIKETQLIVGEKYKITQENKAETVKLMAVNDSLISVSIDKTEKDISISNINKIEEQKLTLAAMIGVGLLIGAIWLTVEIIDLSSTDNE